MPPIVTPATPDVPTAKLGQTGTEPAALSPMMPKSSESPIFFNVRIVARRYDVWEDMLERTLLCQTLAVVEE